MTQYSHSRPAGEPALVLARRVVALEAAAIAALSERINDQFLCALQLILDCRGRVVVTGMGKSGHIARKIAATLASTGTPAFFVHPGEAAHGDLGMITSDDAVLALSNSGESDEVLTVLPALRRKGVKLIAMTGNPASTLAREADVHLDSSVAEEACPLGLAPTSSTTAALVLGDALAVSLLDARGFGSEDFAISHPAGSLGRRLLVRVQDVMHVGESLPKVVSGTPLREALLEMSSKGLGMTAVVNAQGRLVGVFTDGDLRRALDRDVDIRSVNVDQLMTSTPCVIEAQRLAVEAAQVMEARRINGVLVVDAEGMLAGALNMHDLLRARVV